MRPKQARAAEYRKQKADQEAADKAAAEAEAEQRKQAYEDRKAQERAEAEEKARQHQEAWEARQENHDYPTEILDTFMTNINEVITEATKDGQETADPAHAQGDRELSFRTADQRGARRLQNGCLEDHRKAQRGRLSD